MDGIGSSAVNSGQDAISEAEAVRRTLDGDTSAFETLVRAHIDEVRAVCRKHSHSVTDAEDTTQEVFLRAYRSLDSFRTDGSFGAWIRGIALNQVRTHYARFARRRERESPYEYDSADDSHGPEDRVADDAEREAIRNAVEELKPSIRAVVQRYYFDEQSVEDIAEALGLSKENVKSRLHRGRKVLRRLLVERATEP